MIKLDVELKENGVFSVNNLEHQWSSTAEALLTICTLIEQIEKFTKLKSDEIYELIKKYYKIWNSEEKQELDEKLEEI